MSNLSEKSTIWVMTERGLTGTENQCLGIAQALGGPVTIKRIRLKWPFRFWSPFLSFGEGPGNLTPDSDPLTPPFPDILIAGGRKAIGIARYIRRASNGKTLVCIVQDPRVRFSDFDLIALPAHDRRQHQESPHVIITNGAANLLTPELLEQARTKWAPVLAPLPGPRVAVLIGGNSKTHHLKEKEMAEIIAHLTQLKHAQNASLMITISRRTPANLAQKLIQAFSAPTDFVYTGQGKENPYHGFLAFADQILCTNDSVSMISDAATTGKPITILPLSGRSARHDRFITHLTALGVTQNHGGYTPWTDAKNIATRIQELLEQRKTKEENTHV